MPGDTRVSCPDGSSRIYNNFQLLKDDFMQLVAQERARGAVEALARVLESLVQYKHYDGLHGADDICFEHVEQADISKVLDAALTEARKTAREQ
jgi:hypothetical protein